MEGASHRGAVESYHTTINLGRLVCFARRRGFRGALVYATPNRPRLNALDASPSPLLTNFANSSKETSPLESVSAAANVCAAVASSVLIPVWKSNVEAIDARSQHRA